MRVNGAVPRSAARLSTLLYDTSYCAYKKQITQPPRLSPPASKPAARCSRSRLHTTAALKAPAEGAATPTPLTLKGEVEVEPDAAAAASSIRQAPHMQQVVQVLTLHSIPNFRRPWEPGNEVESSSTGFIVDRAARLLMTTAGAVEHAKKVDVVRVGDPTEYKAAILAVSRDCDCAVLTVQSDEFWSSAGDVPKPQAVQLSQELPPLQSLVQVAGFPIGGTSFCVTSGVVSRMEVVEYNHSGRALLALQVDAAINNGSWGSPIFDNWGACVGMAFQKFSSQSWMERYDEGLGGEDVPGDDSSDDDSDSESDNRHDSNIGNNEGTQDDDDDEEEEAAENIGYVVPSQLLLQVLQDYKQHGQQLLGLPHLGVRWQMMELPALRSHFGLQKEQSGVLVVGIDPTGSASGTLQQYDVITHIQGQRVAHDGMVLLRPCQHVLFGYWASKACVGDMLHLSVVRQGMPLQLQLRLKAAPAFIATSLGFSKPQYLIVSGLVFLTFTEPYLCDFKPPNATRGRLLQPWDAGHLHLVEAMEWGMPLQQAEEVVMVSELLECDATEGYDELEASPRRLVRLNGHPVLNLKHLVHMLIAVAAAAGSATATATAAAAADGGAHAGSSHSIQPQEQHRSRDADEHSSSSEDVALNATASTCIPVAHWQQPDGSTQNAAPGLRSSGPSYTDQDASNHGSPVSSSRDSRVMNSRAEDSGPHHDNDSTALGRHQHSPAPSSPATAQSEPLLSGPCSDPSRVAVPAQFLKFEFSDGAVIMLDAADVASDTVKVLQQHSIGHALSAALRAELQTNWPFEANKQRQGGLQRRQQKRRLAIHR